MAVVFNPFTKKLDFTGSGSSSGTITGTYKSLQPLSPIPDGTVVTFTAPDTFTAASITPFLNGLAEVNFTVAGSNMITFSQAPFVGEDVRASYQVAGASTSSVYGSAVYGIGTYA